MSRLLPLLLLALGAPARAEVYIWVDPAGHTHITDDLEAVPEAERDSLVDEGAALRELWGGEGGGPPIAGPADGSGGRVARLLRGAVDDLERGETSRAVASLETVLRLEPGRPEPHFYLGLLAQRRHRLDEAQVHYEAFLARAGDDLEPWRQSARRRLAALDDERRLADADTAPARTAWRGFESPYFRVRYDARLGETSPDLARKVLRYLAEARAHVEGLLGAAPDEATGVVLYGRAAYVRAHAHRFSFQTVGFFDGSIHVVSAAHPAGELRSLLFHEYTHAVYRARTGGDQPFWLNEGLAELIESGSRRVAPLARADLAALRARLLAGRWIALRRLSPGFGGLSDDDARAAYLEATAAARWLERNTSIQARGRLLARLAEGMAPDLALREVVDRDVDGVDAAVQADVLGEFPEAAGGALESPLR